MHFRIALIYYTIAGILEQSLEFIHACLVHVKISLVASLIAYTYSEKISGLIS